MARPRFRFGLVRAPHEPPTSGGYRGALVRLQARDGSRTSDKLPSLAITAAQAGLAFCSEPSRAKRVPSRASASITGCVRKTLLRLRPSAYLTRDHRRGAALSPLVRFPLVRFSTTRNKERGKSAALYCPFFFVRFSTKTTRQIRRDFAGKPRGLTQERCTIDIANAI